MAARASAAWQETVRALLDVSDAVLLDLRGFPAARRGTTFEVWLLAERDALKRSVFLIDSATDMSAIAKAIADITGAAIPQDRVLRSDTKVTAAIYFGYSRAELPNHGRKDETRRGDKFSSKRNFTQAEWS